MPVRAPILSAMLQTEPTGSSIDQGVDRKTLKTIQQRFLQVNNARLARTRSALVGRQQIFLELLPMLFHVNHPMLPGYISHQTPCGLADYEPGKRDIQKTQRLARSFTYRRQPSRLRQIDGLFLMGSSGSIAQSGSSDLDIWVCHPADFDQEQLLLLRAKTHNISRWGRSLGLEVHFFLMDSEKFRLGEREALSTEDCGSSQHYLLLDEFYRTGLLIAGRIPIWWLIPPAEEKHHDYYAATLLKKRFIRPHSSVDFGGVGHIPAGEFIGAGVWQLYKAIDSPYKSALKILLTEVYAAEYPDVEPLSAVFKRAVYRNQLDIDELDPYVMVYRKLEQYLLARNEPTRLALIRRCFYVKVGQALSRPPLGAVKSWQRRLMEKLVAEWEWSPEYLAALDGRSRWKVDQVISEQKALVREITNSYRFLLEFARRSKSTALINSREMTVLGRKLYAAFERKAGKVEWINPGIAPNLTETSLCFYRYRSQDGRAEAWAVSNRELKPDDLHRDVPLKRNDSLVALLAWCHYNKLLDRDTRLLLVEGNHQVSNYELQSIVRAMQQRLPSAESAEGDNSTDIGEDKFVRAMQPEQIQLFINVGMDPMAALREQGIERISDRTDSLGFSEMRDNLVLSIDQITVNSWGEITTQRFDGEFALIRCLREYMQLLPPGRHGPLPQLDIRCYCRSRAPAIALRIEELFRDIAACYYSGTRPVSSRYVLEIEREFYMLQFADNRLAVTRAENFSVLLKTLGAEQPAYSPIVLDRYCLQDTVIPAITKAAQPETIQVFYQRREQQASVFVLDEMGSLYHFDTPFVDEMTLLSPLDQFIQSTLLRQRSETVPDMNHPSLQTHSPGIDYYEIVQTHGEWQTRRRELLIDSDHPNAFHLQAIAERTEDGNLQFTLYCDGEEFSELEHGLDLYRQAARHVLERRSSKQRYPCYITDLDLSRCLSDQPSGATQTVSYLLYKQQLEDALNNAMALL